MVRQAGMPVLQLRLVLGPKNRELCVGYTTLMLSLEIFN
jgi:hypothetical protein